MVMKDTKMLSTLTFLYLLFYFVRFSSYEAKLKEYIVYVFFSNILIPR